MAIPAPAALPQSSLEQRYKLLVENINDYAIYMLSPEGRVASWNAGAQHFKGYTAAEIIGEHFSRFYSDEDRATGLPERALHTAREQGKFEAEGWRMRKDGTRFWAHVVIDPVRNAAGELVGFAKITRDITEKKRAEEALRESESRFRLLVQGVTDYAIYMLSPEGNITNWNLGAARIKGYADHEVVGTHFSRFYTPEDACAGMPAHALATALREGRYEAEGWRVRKDGSRFWAHVVIDPVHDDDGRMIGYAKITRDITDRRETERKLDEARTALVHAQKMEAIGRLTGGIAHDFNNLLAGILGNLDLMRVKLAAGDLGDMERNLEGAASAAKRSAALTHRLLAYSRRQALSPRPVDANTLILSIADMLQRSTGPQVVVEFELEPASLGTVCDPAQLESALLNLVINSRDAMPNGGRIVIASGTRAPEGVSGEFAWIGVTDNGTGMPPDVIEHVFEPFYTTKPLGEGTGLGLSMVHGFIKQSGGHVEVVSAPGRGTTMNLYLPRYEGEIERGGDGATPAAERAPASRRTTVLLVDDEAAVRISLVEMLEHEGFDVVEAGNAAEALAALQTSAGFDVMVTDIGLPAGMNGRQLAVAARALRPALPVLFITGYAEQSVLGSQPLPPGMALMVKPFVMEDFIVSVQALAGP